jgi:phosphorylcholine metabolism protein LicD
MKVIDNNFLVCDTGYQRFQKKFAKLSSELFIDVFPIDGVPSSIRKQKHFFFLIFIWESFRMSSISRFNLSKIRETVKTYRNSYDGKEKRDDKSIISR